MPDAVWKNRRRLTPWRLARRSPISASRSSTCFCWRVWRSGKYSSLETICVGMGNWCGKSSAGSSCARSSSLRNPMVAAPGLCLGVAARHGKEFMHHMPEAGPGIAHGDRMRRPRDDCVLLVGNRQLAEEIEQVLVGRNAIELAANHQHWCLHLGWIDQRQIGCHVQI